MPYQLASHLVAHISTVIGESKQAAKAAPNRMQYIFDEKV
jgi:hypothetical protein